MANITIVADYTKARIITPLSAVDNQYLISKTHFHPQGYQQVWRFKKGQWDGYENTYDAIQQMFRIGLLERISYALRHLGHNITITRTGISNITRIPGLNIDSSIIRPYEFQQKCRQLVHDHDVGLIESATGTGKSCMMALTIDELKCRTLLIFNDLVLCDQMYRNLTKYFPSQPIGYIGNTEFDLQEITCATVQSLASVLGLIERKKKPLPSSPYRPVLVDWLSKVGMVWQDEAHLSDSDTAIGVYDLFVNIPKRFGTSATNFAWGKLGNVELEQVFGKVIYSTTDIDMVALGLRVPCLVRNIEVTAQVPVYGTFHDNQGVLYKKCLKYEILTDPVWAATIKAVTDEYTTTGATVFVYAAHSLEYGQKIADLLGAPFVQGKTPRKERFKIFDALQNRSIQCIVSDIGGIGLDIPSLDVFILASDSKDIRQMAGRVVRSSPNKTVGTFVNLFKRCSYLESHHKTRLSQFAAMGAMQLGA